VQTAPSFQDKLYLVENPRHSGPWSHVGGFTLQQLLRQYGDGA